MPNVEHDWFLEPGEYSVRNGEVRVVHPVLTPSGGIAGEALATDAEQALPIAEAALKAQFLGQQTLRRVLAAVWANPNKPAIQLHAELRRGAWTADMGRLGRALEVLAQHGLITLAGTGPVAMGKVSTRSARDLLILARTNRLNLDTDVHQL